MQLAISTLSSQMQVAKRQHEPMPGSTPQGDVEHAAHVQNWLAVVGQAAAVVVLHAPVRLLQHAPWQGTGLQLDSDDAAKMMWGDAGRLYFWIRDQDLRERRFDKTWMIYQCG